MNNKWRNYGLWLSLSSLVLLFLQGVGIEVVPEQFNNIIAGVLGVLVTLGVISNPKSGHGFVDVDKEEEIK